MRSSLSTYVHARVLLIVLAAALSAIVSTGMRQTQWWVWQPAAPVSVLPELRVDGQPVGESQGGAIYMVGVRRHPVRMWERVWRSMTDAGSLMAPPTSAGNDPPQDPARFMMDESKLHAATAALQLLGENVTIAERGAEVVNYDDAARNGSPFVRGDVVTAVAGRAVTDRATFVDAVHAQHPGAPVAVDVSRAGKTTTVQANVGSAAGKPSIGLVVHDAYDITLPHTVDFVTSGGGSSAGLAYALAVYEARGPALLRGRRVAATGSIDERGRVYAVGAVHEKAVGAQRAGVEIFVVPSTELRDAQAGVRDACSGSHCMRVIGVRTLYQAVLALEPAKDRARELVVNPAFHSDPHATPVDACMRKADYHAQAMCLSDGFAQLAYERGPKVASDTLVAMSNASQDVVGGLAHALSHRIGEGALARMHGDVARALAEQVDGGAGGYYHGVVMAAMARAPEGTDFAQIVPRVCASVRNAVPLLRGGCFHALGHALMLQLNRDLPASLSYCDSLEQDVDRTSCYIGVFMENTAQFRQFAPGSPSRFIRKDDPLYPCDVVLLRYKSTCYENAGLQLGAVFNFRWARVAQECRRVPMRDQQDCMASVGNYIASGTRWHAKPAMQRCAMTGSSERLCFEGMVRSFTHRSADGAGAVPLCTAGPAAWRPQCYSTIGAVLRQYGEAKHHDVCTRIAGAYLANCLDGRYLNQVTNVGFDPASQVQGT